MHHCKCVFAAILCFGIAGFAIASLASAGSLFAPQGNPTALQSGDDPVRNGLRIIETRRADGPRLQRKEDEDSAVILLDEWVFTDKGKPSPYE